jgi:hypothetical protein
LHQFIESSTWIERKHIDVEKYWDDLAESKFLLAPWGNGIQSPKFFEAFMVKTVCVTMNISAFYDLKRMGYPLILVDRWSDVTKQMLENWYDKYYHTINWNEVRNLLRRVTVLKIIKEELTDCLLHPLEGLPS